MPRHGIEIKQNGRRKSQIEEDGEKPKPNYSIIRQLIILLVALAKAEEHFELI
jgi:hypothetical protein